MALTVALSSLSPYLQDKLKGCVDKNGNVDGIFLERLLTEPTLPYVYREEINGLLNGNQNWGRYDGFESQTSKPNNEPEPVKKEEVKTAKENTEAKKENSKNRNKISQEKQSERDPYEYYSDSTILFNALGNACKNVGKGIAGLIYFAIGGYLGGCAKKTEIIEIVTPEPNKSTVNIIMNFNLSSLITFFNDKTTEIEDKLDSLQVQLDANNLTIMNLVQQFTDYIEYAKQQDNIQNSQISVLQNTLNEIKKVVELFIAQYAADQKEGKEITAKRHQDLINYLSALLTISNINGENLELIIEILKDQGIKLNDIMAALINNGESINKVIDLAKQNGQGIDEVKKEFNNVYAGQEEILAAINNVLDGVKAGNELSANNEKLLLSLIDAVKKLDQNDADLKADLANIMTKLSEAVKEGKAFISEGFAGAVTEISTQISKSDSKNHQRYKKIMEKLNATVDLVSSNITISEKTSETLDKVYAVITGLNGKFDEDLLPLATEILDRINQLASDTQTNHDKEIELLGKILTNHENSSDALQKGIADVLALINSDIEIDKDTQKLINTLFNDLSTQVGLSEVTLLTEIVNVKNAIAGVQSDLAGIVELLKGVDGKLDTLSADLKESITKLTGLMVDEKEISEENNKLIKLILEHVAKCEASDTGKMTLLNAILERVNYSIDQNKELSDNESALIETVLGQTSENNAILKDNQALIIKLFDKIDACKDKNNPEVMEMLDRILARFNDVMSQNEAYHKSEMKVLESILDNIESMNADMREGVSKLLGLIEQDIVIGTENQKLIENFFKTISSGNNVDADLKVMLATILNGINTLIEGQKTLSTDLNDGINKLFSLVQSNKNITEENQNLIMKLFNVISSGGYDDTKLMAIVNDLLAKVNTSIENQAVIQDNQAIFYTNIMNAIAELTELAKDNPEFDCTEILNAIKDVAGKVDTLDANQKTYYENIMQAIANVSAKVETGNAEQKEFYKGVMQGIAQLTEQVDALGVDFAKAIAQLTGLLRDDITLDKENQELIRKLFSSIAALGGSNDDNTVLLGLLKEILDGVNKTVDNTNGIKDDQAKYYTSIMDAINNLTSLMAKYPNNDDFLALMTLVKNLSGKVDTMSADQKAYYTNLMQSIANVTAKVETGNADQKAFYENVMKAIAELSGKVDTATGDMKAYYENLMKAIADVSGKVETGNAEQKAFYEDIMKAIVQIVDQNNALAKDFGEAIAQLTGLLRDDITLDKENQELIRKLFSSIAALGGSNDGNTVLLGLLKEILDGVNKTVNNTDGIKDEQAKYYTSIMDAINNLTSLMAKYPNNDDFSALMELVKKLSGKVDTMSADQKAYYTNLMQSIANVTAKVETGNAEQKAFYENVMKAIAELSGKVDSATGDMKAYYENLMLAIANASGKIDKVDANQQANYEKLMQAIMNLAGKVDKVDENQKAYYKAQADAIAKLSDKLDALGNTANKILEVVNGIATDMPVDMAKIQNALAELKAMVKAQGDKIDNIDANVVAAQTLLLGIAASNEELKEWAVKIYNKIPPACQHKDCNCNAQLTIIIEKLEELSKDPSNEGIKGDLSDILG
ncbi:MAG: hypothetical protein E7Z89_00790 [Cyanobacteria bacterium SIG28]|nr:hypothetical protein [Cyanobacteria bacterium SIG28]